MTKQKSNLKGKWRDDLGKTFKGPTVLKLQNVPLDRLPYYEKIGK